MRQYEAMRKDIDHFEKTGLDEDNKIERCYQVCVHHWRQLQHALAVYRFESEEEEIDFFKNIKPLFVSEIEYQHLMYHAQLFKPLYEHDELYRFWLRESLRLEKFTEAHTEFYNYYKNKETRLDSFYFLRANIESTDILQTSIIPLDKDTSTSHDHLLSRLVALEKYDAYVKVQLEKLNRGGTETNIQQET